jgi:cytochrome c oxidase subunit 2
MKSIASLLPEQASTVAGQVDRLYLFLFWFSVISTILVAVLAVFFAVKYRRRSEAEKPAAPHEDSRLEIFTGSILLVLLMAMFGWGATVFFRMTTPPAGAMEVFVTGKQWMWKLQHPQGKREINELHIPVNTPVKLTMTSEDVIHSFYVPAFRVKQDAVPGRFTTVWFEATKTGKYHLFCTEYCGAEHSKMGGWVYVLSPADYEQWLRSGPAASGRQDTPEKAGEKLFTRNGCVTCHLAPAGTVQLGPSLAGVLGQVRKFDDGTETVADEAYLRDSILNSQAKTVAGFQKVMPNFKGQISEEQVMQLIAYIKSLAPPAPAEGEKKP